MPNIRIKDIATTAAATASGDFLAVDSSSGTRKLDAFSPTFGGNLAVSGTGTINGTTIPASSTLIVSGGALGTPSSGTVTNLTGTASININGTVGATTPNSGAFTDLTSSSTTTLNGTTIPASKTIVVTTDKLSALAATTSAELAGVISDETGTGALVFADSPTLVTPSLGTPSSATLTNATGLPVSTGISGLGTGVASALAVNVGSAGAPVVNGGALGTPSSGTVTNLTGTASININGTVGATTPSTGAFTTLSASTSVTTPSLTNAGTLALSATGANVLTASTNGSERLRIDASGNVGIGASPYGTGTKLSVSGRTLIKGGSESPGDSSGAGLSLSYDTVNNIGKVYAVATGVAGYQLNIGGNPTVFLNSNTGAEQMRIDASGNVGIGGTPSHKLHVFNNSTAATHIVTGNTQATVYYGADVNGYGYAWQSSGPANSGFSVGTNVATGFLALYAGGSERARIDASGNVGIGTSSPNSLLHIERNQNAFTGVNLYNPNGGASASSGIYMRGAGSGSAGGGGFGVYLAGNEARLVNDFGNAMTFWTNATQRMQIDGSGNVGIGTSSPAAKLDAFGTAAFGAGGASGFNIVLRDYTTSTVRNWGIRDDAGIDRLRFARGASDYAFWDVLKTSGADSVAYNQWRCEVGHQWYVAGAEIVSINGTDLQVASGKGFKLGNAYVAGAPTATGYVVIKDSTGTSYKIPAVAV